jgi:hypothetical protein
MVYLEEGYARALRSRNYKYIATRYPASLQEKVSTGKQQGITHMGPGIHAFSYITMEYFPGYFDADQLYDVQKDPYEQHNLAGDPAHATQLEQLKNSLGTILEGFSHPFDLSDTLFFGSREYREAAGVSRSRGTDFIPWWNRKLDYPPSPNVLQP